jgi:hypothetical protein
MKKIISLLILTIFIISLTPTVIADSQDELREYIGLHEAYKEARKEFKAIKKKLDDCLDDDKTCSREKKNMLKPAKAFTEKSIHLMIGQLKRLKGNEHLESDAKLELLDAINELNELKEDIRDAEDKESVIDVAQEAKTIWEGIKSVVNDQTVIALTEGITETIQKSFKLADRTFCSLEELKDAGKETIALENSLDLFEAKVNEAQDFINDNKDGEAIEIKEAAQAAKLALKEAKEALADILEKIKSKEGSLCSAEEAEDIERHDNDDSDDEESEEDDEETETIDEDELEDILKENGIYGEYTEAVSAIEEAEDYIEDQEDDGYTADAARVKLREAQSYLTAVINKAIDEQIGGAFSGLLNAKRVADEVRTGRNLFSLIQSAAEEVQTPGEVLVAFADCMVSATYTAQKYTCFDNHQVPSGEKDDVMDCLDEGQYNAEYCYALAESAQEYEPLDQTERVQERLDNLEDRFTDLLDDLEDLEQTIDDSDNTSNQRDDLEDERLDLVDDVEREQDRWLDNFEDVQDYIDDDELDLAEDEIDNILEDIDTEADALDELYEELEDDI